jgi:poly-gamma-glutamate synthesis protein (capsule biosynthesis protein)
MAVGDLMLARAIGEQILAQGPQVVFAGVQSTFDSADLLVGNLECAISDRGQPEPGKAYAFAAPPTAADALAGAGFDMLSLANNHAFDYGPEALADTQHLLDERGIAYVGAGADEIAAHRPVFVERNGLRLAFLAYVNVLVEDGGFDTRRWTATADSSGVAWAHPDRIRSDVAAARAEADVVIVLLHSGYEGRLEPSPNQRQEAQAAIEGGAALVLGAHPHVLQPVEHYQNGLIVYSLGNFVFDDFGFPANYTAIFSAALTPDGVREFNWIPAIVEAGLPRLATPDEASRVLALLGVGAY